MAWHNLYFSVAGLFLAALASFYGSENSTLREKVSYSLAICAAGLFILGVILGTADIIA